MKIATGRNGFRRMAAMACVLAFSIGPMQLLPAAFALAAGLERSHAVLIIGGAEGGTTIVLRHLQEEVSSHSSSGGGHRHGMASKAICALADSPRKAADHVASFTSCGAAEDAKNGMRLQPCSPGSPPSKVTAAAGGIECLSSQLLTLRGNGGHLSPGSHLRGARQRCLRSMCLLI